MDAALISMGLLWICSMMWLGIRRAEVRGAAVFFSAVPGFGLFWYGIVVRLDILFYGPLASVALASFLFFVFEDRKYARAARQGVILRRRYAFKKLPMWRRMLVGLGTALIALALPLALAAPDAIGTFGVVGMLGLSLALTAAFS